ncbi:hypothetical protein HGRIS_009433 [Hohenbuehelia grisea]|uniref:DUF676 domain-containing protein n=1 Tax=Hohenbuehelia grisea TaxID=104357 RepID=A0ABR3J190_9AGAR
MDTDSQPVDESQPALVSGTPEFYLLVIFIHGFKGNDETFGSFPERLQHVLSETLASTAVECIVFPAYETKGDLNEAVIRFADWLTTLTVEKEVACGGGAGKAQIVLCGHSMGGLLAADSLLEFIRTRPDQTAPLWPKIIACIAFDTPYLGLHPFVFKNSASKAFEYASTAHSTVSSILGTFSGKSPAAAAKGPVPAIAAPPSTQAASSGWSKWAPAAFAVGGALMAGAAAGGVYYKRDDIGEGYSWFTDHMKYVGNLWNEGALKARVEALVDAQEKHGVTFRTMYTYLPPSPPAHFGHRTFIVLPAKSSRASPYFVPAKNTLAEDELRAHTGMFGGSTNDGYYELGLETARLIREAVTRGKGIIQVAGAQTLVAEESSTDDAKEVSKEHQKQQREVEEKDDLINL